ncbi:MAG: DNA primase [Thermoanaerobaculum sp.]
MSRYELSPQVVERIRQAADIVAVVSDTVSLRKAGKDFVGLCPFHGERTPSFYVSPDKGTFYCFGCRKGGSVFDFVMETQHLSFPEAAEYLAKRFGVELPLATGASRRQAELSERILQALEEAQAFFLSHLSWDAPRAFLESRGVTLAQAQELGLGFAPGGWRNLVEHLQKRGVSEQVLKAAGLVVQGADGRLWDRFRERVTIPIRTFRGQLVAFGGRSLKDEQPKYLNSPETSVFSKSTVLFGGPQAAQAMAREGHAIVVEGYFDCLALHLSGFPTAVATLGTALSETHARDLARRVQRVFLCYDGDAAGRRATEAACATLLAANLEVSVVLLPEGTDPDLFIRRQGPGAFSQLLESAVSPAAFLLRQAGDSLPARRQRLGVALAIINRCPDPGRRYALVEELARGAGVPVDHLEPLHRPQAAWAQPAEEDRIPAGELALLRGILVDTPLERRSELLARIPVEELQHPLCRQVLEVLARLEGEGIPLEISTLSTHINEREARRLVAALEYEAPPTTEGGLERILRELWERQRRQRIAALTEDVRRAERAGDRDAMQRALAEIQAVSRRTGPF